MRSRDLHVAPSAAEGAARAAAGHLAASPAFRRAPRIAAYVALPHELSTDPLLDVAAAAQKVLLLPKMDPSTGRLAFVRHVRGAELRVGRYGVREPIAEAPSSLQEGDLVVVPGIAFDREGRRLGHGGGWYDRTFGPFARAIGPTLFGFAYADQIVPRVPHGPRDLRVEAIVTERGVIFVDPVERSR
jgi:5-formyltetrahydrofolate cyclo-ligase